jgi:hypothetical protein
MVTITTPGSVPVCATKVAFVAPEGTVTEAGTVTTLELLVRAILSAADAGLAKETVQVTLALFFITSSMPAAGTTQVSPERRLAAGSSVRVAVFATAFNCAPMVAAVTLATAVVAAANIPVVWPDAIVKVGGRVTCVELLASPIDAPPVPALADRVTVHVLEAPPTTVAGAQLTEEIVGGGSTVMHESAGGGERSPLS